MMIKKLIVKKPILIAAILIVLGLGFGGYYFLSKSYQPKTQQIVLLKNSPELKTGSVKEPIFTVDAYKEVVETILDVAKPTGSLISIILGMVLIVLNIRKAKKEGDAVVIKKSAPKKEKTVH